MQRLLLLEQRDIEDWKRRREDKQKIDKNFAERLAYIRENPEPIVQPSSTNINDDALQNSVEDTHESDDQLETDVESSPISQIPIDPSQFNDRINFQSPFKQQVQEDSDGDNNSNSEDPHQTSINEDDRATPEEEKQSFFVPLSNTSLPTFKREDIAAYYAKKEKERKEKKKQDKASKIEHTQTELEQKVALLTSGLESYQTMTSSLEEEIRLLEERIKSETEMQGWEQTEWNHFLEQMNNKTELLENQTTEVVERGEDEEFLANQKIDQLSKREIEHRRDIISQRRKDYEDKGSCTQFEDPGIHPSNMQPHSRLHAQSPTKTMTTESFHSTASSDISSLRSSHFASPPIPTKSHSPPLKSTQPPPALYASLTKSSPENPVQMSYSQFLSCFSFSPSGKLLKTSFPSDKKNQRDRRGSTRSSVHSKRQPEKPTFRDTLAQIHSRSDERNRTFRTGMVSEAAQTSSIAPSPLHPTSPPTSLKTFTSPTQSQPLATKRSSSAFARTSQTLRNSTIGRPTTLAPLLYHSRQFSSNPESSQAIPFRPFSTLIPSTSPLRSATFSSSSAGGCLLSELSKLSSDLSISRSVSSVKHPNQSNNFIHPVSPQQSSPLSHPSSPPPYQSTDEPKLIQPPPESLQNLPMPSVSSISFSAMTGLKSALTTAEQHLQAAQDRRAWLTQEREKQEAKVEGMEERRIRLTAEKEELAQLLQSKLSDLESKILVQTRSDKQWAKGETDLLTAMTNSTNALSELQLCVLKRKNDERRKEEEFRKDLKHRMILLEEEATKEAEQRKRQFESMGIQTDPPPQTPPPTIVEEVQPETLSSLLDSPSGHSSELEDDTHTKPDAVVSQKVLETDSQSILSMPDTPIEPPSPEMSQVDIAPLSPPRVLPPITLTDLSSHVQDVPVQSYTSDALFEQIDVLLALKPILEKRKTGTGTFDTLHLILTHFATLLNRSR
ncbi:hypothetical protein BLNAU_10329 [Blattamonas nauphoetae]|uniref:Uncharacterized protein n=1 Tax=Blattamonas nauphoetae TaxID=2049346 RepID=A0ABQ9XT62_9EUKA|nr:hypothetical protein BLNAU_10329 [Blattamonas nauphoetae]